MFKVHFSKFNLGSPSLDKTLVGNTKLKFNVLNNIFREKYIYLTDRLSVTVQGYPEIAQKAIEGANLTLRIHFLFEF